MGFIDKHRGKYVRVSFEHPEAVGVCDRTGFVFNHKDLAKQYEWRGNRLVWTGMLVGKPFLDVPNPQLRPFVPKTEPRVVKNPRPFIVGEDAPSYDEIIKELGQIRFNKP